MRLSLIAGGVTSTLPAFFFTLFGYFLSSRFLVTPLHEQNPERDRFPKVDRRTLVRLVMRVNRKPQRSHLFVLVDSPHPSSVAGRRVPWSSMLQQTAPRFRKDAGMPLLPLPLCAVCLVPPIVSPQRSGIRLGILGISAGPAERNRAEADAIIAFLAALWEHGIYDPIIHSRMTEAAVESADVLAKPCDTESCPSPSLCLPSCSEKRGEECHADMKIQQQPKGKLVRSMAFSEESSPFEETKASPGPNIPFSCHDNEKTSSRENSPNPKKPSLSKGA
ncbi:hypothetical protein GOODEAATRI_004816, partial [Goodea atripinnis]